MGRILTARDIASLYRVLKVEGVTQQMIAALTGQSQSEVSEILKGRRVRDVTCAGVDPRRPGRSRELMGLSYGEPDAYGGDSTVADPPQVGWTRCCILT